MENLVQYLKAVGVSASDIEILKKETLPEGFDIKSKANELLEVKSRITPEVRKQIEKEAVSKQIPIFKTTLLQKVNKTFGFGLSRSEIEKMEEEDFFKKGSEVIESKVSEASKTGDDELKEKVRTLNSQILDLNEEIESVKKEKEEKLTQMEMENKRKDYESKLRNAYETGSKHYEFSKGISTEALNQLHGNYVQEINKLAKVDFSKVVTDSNGKPSYAITDHDGNELANFDQNGKLRTLGDLQQAIFKRQRVLRVSNGNDGDGDATVIQNLGAYKVTEKTSQRLKDKLARLEAAQKKT